MWSFRRFNEGFWIGYVALLLTATITAFITAWIAGGLTPLLSRIALTAGCLAATGTIVANARGSGWLCDKDGPQGEHWLLRWGIWTAYSLFAFRAFIWLIFDRRGELCVLSPNNMGDLPLHIQYIELLAQGAPLWPTNPILVHSTIGYPFGVDFFNSLLVAAGVDLWRGLIGLGVIGAFAAGIALFHWGRVFGMAGFLFNGGFIGLMFFSTWHVEDFTQTVDWKSIPLSIFVTQRGFLYALPAGLLLLTHWRRIYGQTESTEGRRLPFVLEWLIYATIPLFHLHSFLFLSAVLGVLAVFGRNRRRAWLVIGASVVPATTLVWLLTDGFQAGSHLEWLPGWMQGSRPWLKYWLDNFGIFPPLAVALAAIITLRLRKSAQRRAALEAGLFVMPALAVFTATLFVKFSPWEWDNTKLMMWAYLTILPFLWRDLVSRQHEIVRIAICVLLFGSGFPSLLAGIGSEFKGYRLVSHAEVADVGAAIQQIPIMAVFATAPDYKHPLVFNGRRLALAYHGHMIGHGLDYELQKNVMDELMLGGPRWREAAAALDVSYIFWGLEERRRWQQSTRPWALPGNLIASGRWGEIYRVKGER
ncbi:MAG TPA: hypothetical protein VIT21_04895 [Chthoniobacterales bacterium]